MLQSSFWKQVAQAVTGREKNLAWKEGVFTLEAVLFSPILLILRSPCNCIPSRLPVLLGFGLLLSDCDMTAVSDTRFLPISLSISTRSSGLLCGDNSG